MKKLIILSAIVLSGLIYNSANAQGRVETGFRNGHDNHMDTRSSYRDTRSYYSERRQSAQPVIHNDRVFDRYWDDRNAYPEYRHDIDTRYRGRR